MAVDRNENFALMIVCPNCNHQNPDGAVQCEACYTPLPATTKCPSCGSAVQTDASFCGQCGSSLRAATSPASTHETVNPSSTTNASEVEIPDLLPLDPLVIPDPLLVGPQSAEGPSARSSAPAPVSPPSPPDPNEAVTVGNTSVPSPPPAPISSTTQLQQQKAHLLHIQTNTVVELPQNLAVIHVGKPNDRIPPDLDVSGFPHSDVVSRIHADMRLEGDVYYIEDVGSSNGTYINNTPLPMGNRHRLRPGDRISLGKGDLLTFLFQLS